MLLVEMFLIVIALLLAFLTPRTGSDFFSRIENRFAWLAKRRKLAVLTVGAAALGIRLALLPINPLPLPAVHDEFSYLLAGDTFAHGKLANPTHPMWIHFETFHVNQRPSYVSMYYPAQGLFLAAGQVLFGHPYWGVWLSTGLMCAAICWMLQGWFPPVWALLGGCLAVIRLGTFSYWMNSYWGGSVAALGGALVLGALPRIKRHQRPIDAVLMGLGFALLANSRPYEGLFFSVPILGAIVIWMFGRKAPSIRIVVIRIVAPLLLLFAATLVFMGYYFWRTTGSPFRTPYSVNAAIYRPVPLFPWQGVTNIPKYRNIEMRNFYGGWVTEQYDFARSHPILLLLTKAWATWSFYFGPLLTLPFFAACFVLPYGLTFQQLSTRAKLMLVVCGFVFLGAALPVCYDAHYLAPLSCVFYALVVMAMQKVRNWMPRGKTSGRAIVRSVPLIALMMFVCAVTRAVPISLSPAIWASETVYRTYQGNLLSQLITTPGCHLVIVHYSPDHQPMDEWVHNAADIDRAKIVWARDMGSEQNLALIRYFKDRKVWLVQVDRDPAHLIPYEIQTTNVLRSEGTPQ